MKPTNFDALRACLAVAERHNLRVYMLDERRMHIAADPGDIATDREVECDWYTLATGERQQRHMHATIDGAAVVWVEERPVADEVVDA